MLVTIKFVFMNEKSKEVLYLLCSVIIKLSVLLCFRMSFGWYRAEVIGALASVLMIWFITAILVWLAVERIVNKDFEVDARIMLITSGIAFLVNLM